MFQPTKIVAIILLGLLALVATTIYGDSADNAREPTTAELLKRIDVLEARVTMLEGRTAVLLPSQPQPRIPAQVIPTVPKAWKTKEFNGGYYHIVPLTAPTE